MDARRLRAAADAVADGFAADGEAADGAAANREAADRTAAAPPGPLGPAR
jgi:hypothetical protein